MHDRARRLGALAGAAMAAATMAEAAAAAPSAEAAATTATAATTAAAAFGWGAPIHAEEFTSGAAPSPTSWYVYSSAGHKRTGPARLPGLVGLGRQRDRPRRCPGHHGRLAPKVVTPPPVV
jgi:hypothetical protein